MEGPRQNKYPATEFRGKIGAGDTHAKAVSTLVVFKARPLDEITWREESQKRSGPSTELCCAQDVQMGANQNFHTTVAESELTWTSFDLLRVEDTRKRTGFRFERPSPCHLRWDLDHSISLLPTSSEKWECSFPNHSTR